MCHKLPDKVDRSAKMTTIRSKTKRKIADLKQRASKYFS